MRSSPAFWWSSWAASLWPGGPSSCRWAPSVCSRASPPSSRPESPRSSSKEGAWKEGLGCSSVAEYKPHQQEVVGSKPFRCCAFFFFFLLLLSFVRSTIRSLKKVHLLMCHMHKFKTFMAFLRSVGTNWCQMVSTLEGDDSCPSGRESAGCQVWTSEAGFLKTKVATL